MLVIFVYKTAPTVEQLFLGWLFICAQQHVHKQVLVVLYIESHPFPGILRCNYSQYIALCGWVHCTLHRNLPIVVLGTCICIKHYLPRYWTSTYFRFNESF